MSGGRPILAGRVLEARRTERIAISTPGDFRLEKVAPVSRGTAAEETLLPYCLDFMRRRALYVGGVDPAAAQAAPFYYLHLRRTARRVVSVPWDAGALAPDGGRAPIFLFSPGRCGSTLLSRILFVAGVANVSEPDFYTQATTAVAASPLNPFRATIARAAANMGADLSATLARAPVVKLRAESCRAPELLLQPGERRALFLTRNFESWARSNGRAFRNGAAKSVEKYLRAQRCHAWLRRNAECHLIRYEALEADAASAMAALAAFLGQPIPAGAVNAAMTEDSQGATPLARGARPDRPGWERRFDETMALWNSARIRQARERLGIDELRAG